MDNFQESIRKALQKVDITQFMEEPLKQDYNLEEEVREMIVSTRKRLRMTQKQLAEASGVTQANISRIENGSILPSLQTLKRIADGMEKRIIIEIVDYEEEY